MRHRHARGVKWERSLELCWFTGPVVHFPCRARRKETLGGSWGALGGEGRAGMYQINKTLTGLCGWGVGSLFVGSSEDCIVPPPPLPPAPGRFGADALPRSPGEAPKVWLKRKLMGKALILSLVAREVYPPPHPIPFPPFFFPHLWVQKETQKI